jgi:yecA family protein
MARYNFRPVPPVLQPPNLSALGVPHFTLQDREVLSNWLVQDGWPRSTMGIAMLEGYLVALLAWPVRVHPGAWLPPIWGQTGWKVPAKIESQADYDEFVRLVVGFLEDLDRGLCASPPHFAPALAERTLLPRGQSTPGVCSWAQGFLKALQLLSAQGLGERSDPARIAVTRIARCASSAPMAASSVVEDEIATAVLTLAAERTSRGPLGALPQRVPPPTRAVAKLRGLTQDAA